MTEIATPLELGLIVQERRRALGLTQEEVAARAGVSRRWVSLVESGAPRSELGLVLRLLRSLGSCVSIEVDEDVEDVERGRADGVDLDAVIQHHRRSG